MAINVNGKEYTDEQAQAIIEVMGAKNDTTQSGFIQPMHGISDEFPNAGGLFSRPGSAPDMYSAVPSVVRGLFARLYAGTDVISKLEYDIITGVDDASGTNPTSYCGTPVTSGVAKVGTTRASFGEFFMGTEKITLNKEGGRVDYADVNRRLLNNVAAQSGVIPEVLGAPDVNTTTGGFIYRFAITAMRKMERVLYTGNVGVTGASAEKGFIKEFDGFDRLIKTGYTDVETGNAIPAADSIVTDFANADATVGGNGIVDLMSNIEYRLTQLAERNELDPAQIELGMRPDLFYALTAIWPSSYLTDGNTVTSANGERVNINAETAIEMRDTMRQQRYLMLNGKQIRVNLADGIEQTVNGEGFSTSIYFIPIVAGGERVTFIDGFDQNNAEIQELVQLLGSNDYRTSNAGFWAMTKRQTGMCFELLFAAQPRLIMRTPWLAARIENVNYKLTNGYSRSPYPSEPYYANGGRYLNDPYSGA
jgi:hypothetical protein